LQLVFIPYVKLLPFFLLLRLRRGRRLRRRELPNARSRPSIATSRSISRDFLMLPVLPFLFGTSSRNTVDDSFSSSVLLFLFLYWTEGGISTLLCPVHALLRGRRATTVSWKVGPPFFLPPDPPAPLLSDSFSVPNFLSSLLVYGLPPRFPGLFDCRRVCAASLTFFEPLPYLLRRLWSRDEFFPVVLFKRLASSASRPFNEGFYGNFNRYRYYPLR